MTDITTFAGGNSNDNGNGSFSFSNHFCNVVYRPVYVLSGPHNCNKTKIKVK